MKTQKAIHTHNAIVDAAEALFLQKSVEKVTVNEIARKAGIAKGTFYIYFESKDELVWHFLEHRLDEILLPLHALDTRGFTQADIDAIIDELTAYIQEYEPVIQMIHQVRFYNYLGKRNIEKRYIGTLVEPVCQWISKGKQAGIFKIDDPQFAAYFLTTAIHNMVECVIYQDVPYTADTLGEKLKSLLGKLLLEAKL